MIRLLVLMYTVNGDLVLVSYPCIPLPFSHTINNNGMHLTTNPLMLIKKSVCDLPLSLSNWSDGLVFTAQVSVPRLTTSLSESLSLSSLSDGSELVLESQVYQRHDSSQQGTIVFGSCTRALPGSISLPFFISVSHFFVSVSHFSFPHSYCQ